MVRVINYATVTPDPYTLEVTFAGPEEFVPGRTETWKLTCSIGGEVVASQDLLIARGERQSLEPCGPTAPPDDPPNGGSGPCANRIEGTGKRDKLTGTVGLRSHRRQARQRRSPRQGR